MARTGRKEAGYEGTYQCSRDYRVDHGRYSRFQGVSRYRPQGGSGEGGAGTPVP